MNGTWKNEKIPSMKRRMEGWDYSQPRIYMITLETERRKALLGRVAGCAEKTCQAPDGPRFMPSVLGIAVERQIEGIPAYYPQIRVLGKQLMPDHVHFIIHVQRALPVHLGKVIAGFKAGCNKAWRALGDKGDSQERNYWPPDTRPPSETHTGTEGAGSVLGAEQFGCSSRPLPTRRLWAEGYHDRLLAGQGQLQRMIDYIHDNPRRLLLRRQHSEYFRQTDIRVGDTVLHAVGNLQLLQCPERLQVRCSRSLSDAVINTFSADWLERARKGAVLVSPFISKGEKTVARAAFDAHLPLIVLRDNGFSAYYKPGGEAFEACAEGRLLLLTPYDYHTERRTISRTVCNELNALAHLLSTTSH